eukprot:8999516-Pyramimonas_sp.AAC.1
MCDVTLQPCAIRLGVQSNCGPRLTETVAAPVPWPRSPRRRSPRGSSRPYGSHGQNRPPNHPEGPIVTFRL